MLLVTLSEKTATCTLPSGEHVKVTNRVPLYTLARKLEVLGYGDCLLQAYTPAGTATIRSRCAVFPSLEPLDSSTKFP